MRAQFMAATVLAGMCFPGVVGLRAEIAAPATVLTGLTVYVHNFSDLDDVTIAAAARDAESIFERVGVGVHVVNDRMIEVSGERRPASNFAHTPADLVVNLLTREMAAALPVNKVVLGLAPGAQIVGRNLVHVFAHRVRELRETYVQGVRRGEQAWMASESRILAYAIAHEIGHVLLNMASHPDRGIMRGEWKLNDLRAIAAMNFHFSDREALRMRSEAARRLTLAAPARD